MNRKVVVSVMGWLLVVFVCGGSGIAKEYHVVPDGGDDANPGTTDAPLRTLRYAITIAAPGDTLTLYKGRYPVRPPERSVPSFPAAADETEAQKQKLAELTARIERLEERVFFDESSFLITRTATAAKPITIRAARRNRVVISTKGNGFSLHPEYDLTGFIFDGLVFANCAENSFTAKGSWIIIRNCIMYGSGLAAKNNDTSKRRHHFMVEGCTIYDFRGIPLFPDNVHKVILRNNVILNSGSVAMDPGGVSDMLIENSFVVNTGNRIGALKIRWGNVEPLDGPNCNGSIVRRNVFVDGRKYVLLLASANGAMVYNNTLCKLSPWPMGRGIIYMQRDAVDIAPGRPNGPNKNNVIKNNILYHLGAGGPTETWMTDSLISMNLDMKLDFADQQIDSNCYYTASPIRYIQMGSRAILADQVAGWGPGYDAHSLVAVDPGMIDPRASAGPEGFRLSEASPCIDAGEHLTATIGGGAGTVIRVRDARYFSDGFDMIAGDSVRIGANPPVAVAGRDIAANTLTLAKPIRWADGDPVSLDYQGRRPDIGAYEHGAETVIGGSRGRRRAIRRTIRENR